MKKIVVLGATGTIGQTVIDVARFHPDRLKIVGVSGNKNIELLEKIKNEFSVDPKNVVTDEEDIIRIASMKGVDTVVVAITGIAALKPTLEAIKAGNNIALASKEIIVMTGNYIVDQAKKYGVSIVPIDSELSAIMQSLIGSKKDQIEKYILTCSGGPFLGKKWDELADVTPEMAVKHPAWSMGRKISVDSATLMNKGFEVIEICRYFETTPDKVEVVVHPEAIVHSGVMYNDGALINQMGLPDKHLQVQYALFYPERAHLDAKRLSLTERGKLTFYKPDLETFPCLKYAYDAINIGGSMPSVLAAADEVAVNLFLNCKIKFLDIPKLIKSAMDNHKVIQSPTFDDLVQADTWAREYVLKVSEK
jgi:1-deoxy-D-xylulose-5-phosphate reductoisomerase